MSAVVQVFPKQVDNRQGATNERVPVEGSAVFGIGNYLPSIDTDGQQQSGQQNGQGDNHAANVLAALGAPTDQFESFVNNVTRLPTQPNFPMGSNVTNAALWNGWVQGEYATENFFEVSRRVGWGDFRQGQRGGDKYMTLSGKPITFDPDDIGIRFDLPYELAAAHTTVTQEDYDNVYFHHREAHVNAGNPRKDRLEVYNLGGMSLESDFA